MPGMSPRTQAFMQPPPTADDATRAFEDGFSQMAQGILGNKFPELMDKVVTFKVLESDLDNGSGIGAFVLDFDGIALYVPAILSSNQIKPLAVVYYKDKDIFLPLNKEWLGEIERNALDNLGEGVDPPKELNPDADIRDLVIPPSTGHNVYANAAVPGEKLAAYLTMAPNRVKTAFKQILEKHPPVLKYAFETFDQQMILSALQPHMEKQAAAQEEVVFLTADNTAEDYRKVFGKHAGNAWQTMAKKGYVVADARAETNYAVEAEKPIVHVTAQENGFYKVLLQEGGTKLALVISEPQAFVSPVYAGTRTDMRRVPNEYWTTHRKRKSDTLVDGFGLSDEPDHHQDKQQFLVYFENGDIVVTPHAPVGKWVPTEEVTGPLTRLLDSKAQPATQGYGFFYCYRGGKFMGTLPADIQSVTTGSDSVRRINISGGRTLVSDANSPIAQIVAPTKGNVTYLPTTYKFAKGKYIPSTLLQGADSSLRYLTELEKQGALRVKLMDAGASTFSIGGTEPQTKLATIQSLVNDLSLRVADAERLLEKTAAHGRQSFYLVSPQQMSKFSSWAKAAQGEAPMAQGMPPGVEGGMPPGAEGGMPPEMAGGMPPEMAGGMPPEMMAPPPPPPPSPVDLAASEVEADLAAQSADVAQQLAEQQRDLSNQLSAIAAVKQRAEQIAMEQSGGMPAGPPGEVPQEPPPGAEGGMPPEMAGGMPPEMAGGMPPEMAGGMPPEMASGMPIEGPQSAEMMAQQGGPMMEEAAQLQDPEAFEATAIGAMASDADLREAAGEYMPTLEKALDSLGRILMTLWMRENELREEVGEADFSNLEKRLQSVFDNLGGLVLRINQTALTSPEKDGNEFTA